MTTVIRPTGGFPLTGAPGAYQACRERRQPCFFILMLLGALVLAPWGQAAELAFDLSPKWVVPGPESIVTITTRDSDDANAGLTRQIDAGKKLVLRLSGYDAAKQIALDARDLPIDGEQLRRRLAKVNVPGPLRRGTYRAAIVDDNGALLAAGPTDIKVRPIDKPAIVSIRPAVVYPQAGRFDFEVIGDNFSQYNGDDIDIRINDAKVMFKKRITVLRGTTGDADSDGAHPASPCKDQFPCLVWNWRTLRIYGLPVDHQGLSRPLELSVEADQVASNPKALVLSCVPRSVPIVIAIGILSLTAGLVRFLCKSRIARMQAVFPDITTLKFLLIDPQTNTYSLSKFQILLWSAAAVLAYSYLAVSHFLVQWNWALPRVPDGLPALLGLSAVTGAGAVSATELRGSKGAGPFTPGIGDFITTGGVLAPERLQFFLWTILGALGFSFATLAQDPGTVTKMAEIPDNFNYLMGASSLGYLAGKFVRKPGPVIKRLDPEPPYSPDRYDPSKGIRIIGEGFYASARVKVNDVMVPMDAVAPGDQEPAGGDYVAELVVKPTRIPDAARVTVRVINPDGQCAEYQWALPGNPPARQG